MDVLYCPKTHSDGTDWENAGGIDWSWETEDENSNTEEYTCEGEECDVEISLGTVIIALIVLGGIGFGVWWILT